MNYELLKLIFGHVKKRLLSNEKDVGSFFFWFIDLTISASIGVTCTPYIRT